MDTKIFKISDNTINYTAEIDFSADVLRRGGLVVFPTETVYGLGADATSEAAVASVYEAKGRPSDNPLIIHIARPEDAELYAFTNEIYYKLAEAFMPGALTVILKSKDCIPKKTRGGLDTVAVRCPSNEIARKLIASAGVAIAAPSANLSGSPSPTDASHVIDDMMGRVDVIIDGGECDVGLESTIVKIEENGSLTLLRPGKITVDELSLVVGEVNIADAVISQLKEGDAVLSPGMKYRHYAPKSPVILLDGSVDRQIEYISEQNSENIAILAYKEDLKALSRAIPSAFLFDFGERKNESEQAKRLFAILREADKLNFETIYAPLPSAVGMGLALYNRMIRAAAHKIIRL